MENRPTLETVQPGTKCDFCTWDGIDFLGRHDLRVRKMRREMICLYDDCCLNDYVTLNICFLCRWYLIQPRDHLDWITDDQRVEEKCHITPP